MARQKSKSFSMLNGNQLSRYGAISKVIPLMAPNAKVFFVGASTLPSYADFADDFGPDAQGGNRVFPTINAVIADANSVASRGDVILVLPGHTETITAAGGVALSLAGISLIGLGVGGLRPTLTFSTSAAASFNITAANILVQNIRFVTNVASLTAFMNISAADVTIDQCEFIFQTSTLATVNCIVTAATADRLKVTNCTFYGVAATSASATTSCIKHESGVDYVIENNIIVGKLTQGIVNVATVLRGSIHNNRFIIGTGTVAITMAAASTPFITNNRINVASGTAPITAAAGFVAGNIYSAAAGVTAGTAATI